MTEQEALAKIKQNNAENRKLKIFIPKKAKSIDTSILKDDILFIQLYPIFREDFSIRMIEIITEVVKGKTNVEVGKALFICEKTVKFHLTEIYKRIKLKSRAQLMAVVNEILRAEKEEQSLALPRRR